MLTTSLLLVLQSRGGPDSKALSSSGLCLPSSSSEATRVLRKKMSEPFYVILGCFRNPLLLDGERTWPILDRDCLGTVNEFRMHLRTKKIRDAVKISLKLRRRLARPAWLVGAFETVHVF